MKEKAVVMISPKEDHARLQTLEIEAVHVVNSDEGNKMMKDWKRGRFSHLATVTATPPPLVKGSTV